MRGSFRKTVRQTTYMKGRASRNVTVSSKGDNSDETASNKQTNRAAEVDN